MQPERHVFNTGERPARSRSEEGAKTQAWLNGSPAESVQDKLDYRASQREDLQRRIDGVVTDLTKERDPRVRLELQENFRDLSTQDEVLRAEENNLKGQVRKGGSSAK
jgi:hypothetical protein